jgi:hypothetical protein
MQEEFQLFRFNPVVLRDPFEKPLPWLLFRDLRGAGGHRRRVQDHLRLIPGVHFPEENRRGRS